jgi:hypothetical protein
MAESAAHKSRADRSIAWALVSFVVLAVSMLGYAYAPQIVLGGGKGAHSYYLFQASLAGAAVGIIILSIAVILAVQAATAAPRGLAARYVRALRVPLAITVANTAIGLAFTSHVWSDVTFNVVRVICAVWAGWILGRLSLSVWKSSAAGLALFVLDHVVLKGGWFLVSAEALAFGGVMISFAMFALVPLALGALGGLAARRFPPSNSAMYSDTYSAPLRAPNSARNRGR